MRSRGVGRKREYPALSTFASCWDKAVKVPAGTKRAKPNQIKLVLPNFNRLNKPYPIVVVKSYL